MKILHVVPTYAPAWRHGGPIRAVHGLCKALAARGHEVTVFTTGVDTGGAVPTGRAVPLDGVEVWYFPVRPPRRLYRSPAMGRALADRVSGFDLVHLHSVFLWPTATAARAASRAGVPYLLAPRGMLVPDLLRRRGRWRKTLWIRLVESRTLAGAAGLHVTSDLEAEEAARLHLPLPQCFVIPNGVEPEPYREDAPLSGPVREALTRAPFLLFLGRLSWKKGLDRLIPALAHVPAAILVLAGPDDEQYRPKLEDLARATGVLDRILFTGPVDGADKSALLHRAAALVLPSYSENFGNSVLEAMAAGRPVVVTPEVGLAPAVAASGAGLVVDGAPLHLGPALRDLLADPVRLEAMGERGAAEAHHRFGWPAVAETMESAYERVSQKSGPARRESSPPGPLSHLPPTQSPGEGETSTDLSFSPSPGGGRWGDGRGGRGVRTPRADAAFRDSLSDVPRMNLSFVVERPTQFEAPFYRYAAQDPGHHLRVVFTDSRLSEPVFDPELNRTVSWGFDLLAGYDHAVCPPSGRSRWLARELRGRDLVIINGYTRAPYLLAAAAAHRLGIPTALRLDSVLWNEAPPRPHLKRLLFALALKPGYRLFLGTGTLTLDYLRFFGVPPERTGLFPYAVDVDAFRQGSSLSPEERTATRRRLGLPPGSQVLLSLAKLNPRESPWDLLRAFTRSDDARRRLVLAGDGPDRPALEAFAKAQGADRVLFPGYIPYPELPALYAAADVFIHPAREERWGVSVAEALACGLPVIASSRVGAARDLVTAGRNGFVYQAGDDAELARRLDDALRLSPAEVRAENRAILARWDYAAAWQGILRAAARFQKKVNA